MALLLFSSNRGLELADESSWILSSANPWSSPAFGVFYGYLLHPVWVASGQGVAGFRVAGYLLFAGAGLVFALSLARALPALGATRPARARFWLLLCSIGAGTLTYYSCGLRAPSYNWVLVAGSLLGGAGWLRLEISSRSGHAPWGALLLIGTGLLVAGMGKWTALPGQIVLFLLLWLWHGNGKGALRDLWRMAVWVAVLGMGIAWMIGAEGIRSTWASGWALKASDCHHNLGLMYATAVMKFSWQILRALPWVAGIFGLIWLVLRWRKGCPPALPPVAALTFLAGCGLVFARGHGWGGGDTFSKGIMVTTVWLLGVFVVSQRYLRRTKPDGAQAARRCLILFCLLPFLNGIGTATGITDFMGFSLVFLVAAGWIWLGRAEARGMPQTVLIAAVLCLGLIHASRAATSTWNNFRLGSIWAPMEDVTEGPERGRLRLPARTVRCLEDIHHYLTKEGFTPGEPLIGVSDLPGLVYLLGGVSPGVGWYLGWNRDAVTASAREATHGLPDETLRRAWVLLRIGENEPLQPADFWPTRPSLSAPVAVGAELPWPLPDEVGLGMTTPVRLYPPLGH
jgi:hypothetical protein